MLPADDLKKRAVIVLGMHRSGTSLCMEVLSLLGLRMESDMLPANEFNEHGFFESRKILQLNERILHSIGLTWHSIVPAGMDDSWVDDAAIRSDREQLTLLLNDRTSSGAGIWAFKDPRLCLLLPLYERIFLECNIEPYYVLCIRSPRSIALSLERRNRFPHIFSELLWMDHTNRAIKTAGNQLKAVIQYEDWFECPMEQVKLLTERLKLPLVLPEGFDTMLQNTVVLGLDHGGARTENYALNATKSVYQLLRDGKYTEAALESAEIQRGLRLGLYPASALCQLYWRTAEVNYFTEMNSCCIYTDSGPGKRLVSLPIPGDLKEMTGLRIDPSACRGLARFHSLRVLNSEGATLWLWNGEREILEWERSGMTLQITADANGVLAHFESNDPSLIPPLPPAQLALLSPAGGVVELEFTLIQDNSAADRSAHTVENPAESALSPPSADRVVQSQLFWATIDANCFEEANSCPVPISTRSGRNVVQLRIPATVHGLIGLRFDPANLAGLAHLFSLHLFTEQRDLIWECGTESESFFAVPNTAITLLPHVGGTGVLAHFHTDDPVMILPVGQPELDRISGVGGVLEVEFAWLSIGN